MIHEPCPQKMKFGDIVRNEWASDENPHKILIVLNTNRVITCVALDGKIIKFHKDRYLRLIKVGEICFSEWNQKQAKPKVNP